MSQQVEPKTTTNQNKESKPRYEPPQIILLNEITLGRGECRTGTGDTEVCVNGNSPVGECTTGTVGVDM